MRGRGGGEGRLGELLAAGFLASRSFSFLHTHLNIPYPKMAPTLGKRKRVTRVELTRPSPSPSPSPSPAPHSDGSDASDVQAIFRRAFEAKFRPLDIEPVKPKDEDPEPEDDEVGEETDWSGLSSEEEEDTVEVFDYATTKHANDKASKAELRAFMVFILPSRCPYGASNPLKSSKPPSSSASTLAKATPKSKPDDNDSLEASHLKNDLELQNLLRESHLLSSHAPTFSTRTASAPSSRAKLTDLHIQSLGAKSSIFAQRSMPMSHRKGIAAKSKTRDEKRRAEARENGIILEREKSVKKAVGKRERGVGAPSVGRFKGGTLTLSRKDVASITGGGGRGPNGKKSRR